MKTELKAGQVVRIKDYSKGTERYIKFAERNNNYHMITQIDNDGNYVLDEDIYTYTSKELELVCGFVKGEEVCVSDYENFDEFENEKLMMYVPNVENSYLTLGSDNVITAWTYARPIPKKEYKPYDEPKFEWVKDGEKVIHTGRVHRISSVGVRENGVWFVGLSLKKAYTTYLNMNQFLDECTWLDGSVCGEES